MDLSVALEVLSLLGVAEAARWCVRTLIRRFNRGGDQAKTDATLQAAAKIQGMSAEFAGQMFEREQAALTKADELDKKLRGLEGYIDDLTDWARAAKRELDIRHVSVAPIPIRRATP